MCNRTSILLSWKLRHMELINLLMVTQPTVGKTRFQAQVYPAFVQSSCSSALPFPHPIQSGNRKQRQRTGNTRKRPGTCPVPPPNALYDLGQDLVFPQVSSPPRYDGKIRQRARSLWASPALHDPGPQAQAQVILEVCQWRNTIS